MQINRRCIFCRNCKSRIPFSCYAETYNMHGKLPMWRTRTLHSRQMHIPSDAYCKLSFNLRYFKSNQNHAGLVAKWFEALF